MPIYEYSCKNCGEIFEEFQSIGATNIHVTCPKCGTTKPERVLSAFSASGLSGSKAIGGGGCEPAGSPFS